MPTTQDTLVLLNASNGITLIPGDTPLTRLNYFDGKFLKAEDLQAEQTYLRQLVQLSNQAGGAGVVNGFDLQATAGQRLTLSPGLAIDPDGRVLLLPDAVTFEIATLIERSRPTVNADTAAAPNDTAGFVECELNKVHGTATPVPGVGLYLIGIVHAEALCGHEDMVAGLCANACATQTQRPWRREGVVLQALPLQLRTPLSTSTAVLFEQWHLRSRVASSYFADEALSVAQLISRAGLQSSVWCRGALAAVGSFVPLGVLAMGSQQILFLDQWIARRERIDGDPRRYWQWRMMMRPWDAFLAQILQFQCQLRDVWQVEAEADGDDPCQQLRKLVVDASSVVNQLERYYRATSEHLAKLDLGADRAESYLLSGGTSELGHLVNRLQSAKDMIKLMPTDRLLIRRGIVELPSAGYLPVVPSANFTVNQQIRQMMGEGVDLRFCIVRPDYVAEALQEAQHMERISLTRGLDNPQQKEEVDILVPDGEILGVNAKLGQGWAGRLAFLFSDPSSQAHVTSDHNTFERGVLAGAARSEKQPDGSLRFCFGAMAETDSLDSFSKDLREWAAARKNSLAETTWHAADILRTRQEGVSAHAAAEATARTDAMAMRYARLKSEAEAYRAKRLAYVAKSGDTKGLSHFAGLTEDDVDHVALWIGTRIGTNPLASSEGASIPCLLDLTILVPRSANSTFVDLAGSGRLRIDHIQTVATGTVIQANFTGSVVLQGLFGGQSGTRKVVPINAPVVIGARDAETDSLVVNIDLRNSAGNGESLLDIDTLQLFVALRPNPLQARALMVLTGGQKNKKGSIRFNLSLDANGEVLKTGNPLRAASEAAIQVLATRENTPNFAADALADLFGTRPAGSDVLTILARKDWVLFHRRRTRQCGLDRAPTPVDQRRYQLFHLKIDTEANLQAARAAVLTADAAAITSLGFAQISIVTFDGGRSTIATPAADLLRDWQQANPGPALRFGAIGSQGAALSEGEALARARLVALELQLAGTQKTAVDNVLLPILPPLGLSGLDGGVFLVTLAASVICHEVYRLPSVEVLQRFNETVKTAGLAKALSQIPLSSIAHAEFQPDGKSLTPTAEVALKKAWGGSPAVFDAQVFTVGEDAEVKVQAGNISRLLGGNPSDVRANLSGDVASLTSCRALTILTPRSEVRPGLMVLAPWDDRFDLNVNTPFWQHEWRGAQPVDMLRLEESIREAVPNDVLSLAVAAVGGSPAALADHVLDTVKAALARLGFARQVQFMRTYSLQTKEVDRLKDLGRDPAQYQSIIFFTANPLN
ncbi:hypothetical protein HNQ59_002447 [Chitinivorax tropicus]|uniref:Uncharacterized protein n=1 Tax=Chitinivorax tropicus TaxID=714531 RepID=A0A840MPY4_9PROT|nr:hypothetical protein [Chitinivorax tropicus]MBB5019149.1 hypothetical protein [Chitinivorax tropicus]